VRKTLKTGNFNYRKWALLQIADLRNVFAHASKPLLHCPSVTAPTSVSKWGNVCVSCGTIRSGSRV